MAVGDTTEAYFYSKKNSKQTGLKANQVLRKRSLTAKKSRTKALFSQVAVAVFEGSPTRKLRFHKLKRQVLTMVLAISYFVDFSGARLSEGFF